MLAAVEDWSPAIKVAVILVLAIVLTVLLRRFLTKRAAMLVAKFGTVSTDPVREAGRVRTLSAVTQSAVLGMIWVIAFLAILQVINNAISSFVLAITLLGSALTFGAQSLIRDLLSGFFILLEDQYAVGDVVDLGPATGTVEKVTLRVTRIRDGSGKVWWVPNGQIVRAGNETQDWARAVVDGAVARDSDIDSECAVIGEIASRAVADPALASRILEPPQVLGIQQLTDAKVVLRVSVKVAKGAQDDVKRAIQAGVLLAFKEERLVRPPLAEPYPDAEA